MENLSQKIEKPPTTSQSRNKSPKQGLVEDIIVIKPMISDQLIIQTPSIPENRDPKECEPILEKLMKEREKQAEEFLKKVPVPDHRGQYPYSQGVNEERNLDDQATSPKVLIKSPMREERVTTPKERGDCGKPIGASSNTQVKTKYEVEMDGRRRIGSTEKKGQGTHRRTYPSQPPPLPPLVEELEDTEEVEEEEMMEDLMTQMMDLMMMMKMNLKKQIVKLHQLKKYLKKNYLKN